MIWNEVLEGLQVRLRTVQMEDAEFTYNIRQDREKTRYLHPVNGTLEDQKRWLRQQRKREGDYFFIVETKQRVPLGTIALYNICGDEGEVGRNLLYGNYLQNVETAILIRDFAFYILKLNRLIVTVHEDNIHVQGFEKKLGAKEEYREYSEELGAELIYFSVTEDCYRKKRDRIIKNMKWLKE